VGREHEDRVEPPALGDGRAHKDGGRAVPDDDVALPAERGQGALDPGAVRQIEALEPRVCGQPRPQGVEVAGKFRLHLRFGRHERFGKPQEKDRGGEDQGGIETEEKPQHRRPEGRAHTVGKPHHLRRLVDDEKNKEEEDDGARRKRHVPERVVHVTCLQTAVPSPGVSTPLSAFCLIHPHGASGPGTFSHS